MPRFVAIPVGQGDAFFLEREGISVLVDGGRNRRGFASLFQSSTGCNAVDVAVCTHNDADHANGILGAIESGLVSHEVWLPGRWGDALEAVLRPMSEVVLSIAKGIDEAFHEGLPERYLDDEALPRRTLLERVADDHHEAWSESLSRCGGGQLSDDGWPQDALQQLQEPEYNGGEEAIGGVDWDWGERGSPRIPPWDMYEWAMHLRWWLGCRGSPRVELKKAQVQLLLEAMDAASRIRRIARAAFHQGLALRWFEHDPSHPSGGRAELRPISSRELVSVRRVGAPAVFRALALTVVNRESLVFWSPGNETHPGILFTADSDLRSVSLPRGLDKAIVTAPHHGSEANRNAYQAVQSVVADPQTVTWVRSDGRYRSRPGPSFLGLSSRRLCTICRHGGGSSRKQPVRFFARSGTWVRHRDTRICTCQ